MFVDCQGFILISLLPKNCTLSGESGISAASNNAFLLAADAFDCGGAVCCLCRKLDGIKRDSVPRRKSSMIFQAMIATNSVGTTLDPIPGGAPRDTRLMPKYAPTLLVSKSRDCPAPADINTFAIACSMTMYFYSHASASHSISVHCHSLRYSPLKERNSSYVECSSAS